MKDLAPIYKMVARDVALGISLEDSAEARSLPLREVKRVARGQAFYLLVNKFNLEIDAQLVKEAAEDPVRRKLAASSLKAAEVLTDEMENYDKESGGTAANRIKAADIILKTMGYGSQKQEQNLAVIMLTPGKLSTVRRTRDRMEDLKSVPDMVDGHG